MKKPHPTRRRLSHKIPSNLLSFFPSSPPNLSHSKLSTGTHASLPQGLVPPGTSVSKSHLKSYPCFRCTCNSHHHSAPHAVRLQQRHTDRRAQGFTERRSHPLSTTPRLPIRPNVYQRLCAFVWQLSVDAAPGVSVIGYRFSISKSAELVTKSACHFQFFGSDCHAPQLVLSNAFPPPFSFSCCGTTFPAGCSTQLPTATSQPRHKHLPETLI